MPEIAPSVHLPLKWDSPITAKNDQNWLNSIIQDAAPFTDWWVKARIIQLAYSSTLDVLNAPQPVAAKKLSKNESAIDPNVYAGKSSAIAIATAIQEELIAYGRQIGLSLEECRQQYAYLLRQVNADYVEEVLTYWESRSFTSAISRNFEVFVNTDQPKPNIFLVVSTASVSLQTRRWLPSDPQFRSKFCFRPLFNVDEMAELLHECGSDTMTLRVHGYSNSSRIFYTSFMNEAQEMRREGVLPDNHCYVGYHWPSEQPFLSPGLIHDVQNHLGIFFKFLLSLFVVSFLFSVIVDAIYFLLFQPPLWKLLTVLFLVFLLWFLAFTLLRLVVYQRDRYRAVHYGAPDLAEFFWRLDKQLKQLKVEDLNALQTRETSAAERSILAKGLESKTVNLIGHSMGGLVVVNALRVLSDRFGKDDKFTHYESRLGECFDLGKLILASPDIPLELIREGRNNYVRSAMRRCRQIYLMSSDRDTVLRYLSTLGNWFSEPSLEMSGLRLGNLYLKRDQETEAQNLDRLLIRGLLFSKQAIAPTSAYDLFESFNYIDCSRMKGVNEVGLRLNPVTALLIDAINSVLLAFGRVDVHGGYFRTDTPAFNLFQFLIKTPLPTAADIYTEIERLNASQVINFLPAYQYMTKDVVADDEALIP